MNGTSTDDCLRTARESSSRAVEKARELLAAIDKREKTVSEGVAALLFFVTLPFSIASAVGILIFRGWLLARTYLWFVVPIYHVAPIGTAQAIGLVFVVRLMCDRMDAPKDDPPKLTAKRMWYLMALVWTTNLFGYLIALGIHHFTR